MVRRHTRHFASVSLVGALIAAGPAQSEETAQTQPAGPQVSQPDLEQFRQDLDTQTKALAAQRRILEEQEKQLAAQKRELDETRRRLETLKAKIDGPAPKEEATKVAQPEPSPAQPVGQAPQQTAQSAQPPVVPLFEQPGVLTQRGKFVLEPSVLYSYSSSYRVALLGYTIIPAIHIGLIDIRGVNDSTWISALTGRYGLTNRLEVELKVPYVYRTEAAVTRPIGGGSTQDSVFNTSGKGLGDVEVAARYQINESSGDTPYYIAGVRLKARNGKDPFSVTNTELPGGLTMPAELPTGSGFYAVQPSLSFIYPSDPAVFFGGINFVKNIDRDVGGGRGTVHPGDAVGLNFGMGLALNEKASFSIGLDYTHVGKPSASGGSLLFPAATSTQLATLLFGYSYRFSPLTTMIFSVGAGLTPETPGIQLMLRFPFSF
ncbi:hypothetical protein GALLN_00156 [Gallionellaceae bacterium]|nr:hypothetical protein GALLN_00156 [Gallionellaceae bacterium]